MRLLRRCRRCRKSSLPNCRSACVTIRRCVRSSRERCSRPGPSLDHHDLNALPVDERGWFDVILSPARPAAPERRISQRQAALAGRGRHVLCRGRDGAHREHAQEGLHQRQAHVLRHDGRGRGGSALALAGASPMRPLPAVYTSRAAIDTMRSQGSGDIINVSSTAGRRASGLFGAYSTSKFGLAAMTEGLRQEVGGHGIRVCIIEPGATDTAR